MLKNEREKFYLFAAAVFIITVLLIWQGIFNFIILIEENIGEIKEKKAAIAAYNLKEKSLPAELESYNFSKNKIEKFNNYFVYKNYNDDKEFSDFFSQLDDIANKAAQKTNSLTIELYENEQSLLKEKKGQVGSAKTSVQNNDSEDSRLLKLTFRGNFESFLKFISYLEAMPYYLYIESLNINIDSSSNFMSKALQNENNLEEKNVNLQTVIIVKVFKKEINYE